MEIRNNSTMRREIKKLITKKKEKDMLSSYLIEEEHERVISLDVKETESFRKQCEKRLPHFQNPGALVTKAAIACGNLEANPLMKNYVSFYMIEHLSRTDPHFLQENPYLKYIQTPDTKVGDYHLEKVAYEPMTIILDEEPAVDGLSIAPHFTLLEDRFQFPLLIGSEGLIGAVTPFEIHAYQQMIDQAYGQVVIYGLKLGYLTYMVHLKNDVDHITIIEEREEVIDLFYKQILPQFDHPEKITVMKGRYQDHSHMSGDCLLYDQYQDQHEGLPFYLSAPHHQGYYYLETSILEQLRRLMLYDLEGWLEHQGSIDEALIDQQVGRFLKQLKIKDQRSLMRLFDLKGLKREITKQ
ncbi:MAG: hypothetical protein ACI32Q_00495 [Intestinibaculum porci]|uniref:hypothetical protein n=1 Tax=Intestinibaculum porci TaxID=2487118 RepID=UPI003EFD762A